MRDRDKYVKLNLNGRLKYLKTKESQINIISNKKNNLNLVPFLTV